MAKRKRTREQKKLADRRRTLPPKVDNSVISDTPSEAELSPKYTFTFRKNSSNESQSKAALPVTTYAYLQRDLRKTVILTLSIVAVQILLYFSVNTL